MRILFISNLYPPYDLGGWEQLCQEVVEKFQTRGHNCHVLTSRLGLTGKQIYEEGISRALHLEADIYHYQPLDFFLRRPQNERANLKALRKLLDTFKPDVIFIWGMWNLSQQIAYWAERWMPGRVAYSIAGYWFIQPNVHEVYWNRPARRPLIASALAPARYLALRMLEQEKVDYPLKLEEVACVSKYVCRKLSEVGVLSRGARVIYNGVDPHPFMKSAAKRAPSPGLLRLLYTGSLIEHKGVHTAIEAMGILKRLGEIAGLHLTVVGAGHPDYEYRLKHLVKDLGLADQVTFQGRVPRNQIPAILAKQDVFLFTSIYEEPIARSVMEAMAAGLAVIGTPVGGQPEILENGVNSVIYIPEDANQLANCILRLANDPKLKNQLATAGQETVLERFTLERMVNEMEEWLQGIVA